MKEPVPAAQIINDSLDDRTILDADEFRVLAADLDHRIDPGVKADGGPGMGADLVNDEVGPDELPDELSSRAGRPDADPIEPHPVPLFHGSQRPE